MRSQRGQGTWEYIVLLFLILLTAVAVLSLLCGGPEKLFSAARHIVQGWIKR